jgi:hypothetical protein
MLRVGARIAAIPANALAALLAYPEPAAAGDVGCHLSRIADNVPVPIGSAHTAQINFALQQNHQENLDVIFLEGDAC